MRLVLGLIGQVPGNIAGCATGLDGIPAGDDEERLAERR
jgi:hypothetical protein